MASLAHSITITKDDITTSAADVTKRQLGTPAMVISIIVFVLAAIAFIVFGIMIGKIELLVVGAGLILITALMPVLMVRQARKSMQNVHPVGTRMQTEVSEKGLWMKSTMAEQTISWDAFRSARVVGKTLTVRMKGSPVVVMIPARSLSPEALAYLLEKVPTR